MFIHFNGEKQKPSAAKTGIIKTGQKIYWEGKVADQERSVVSATHHFITGSRYLVAGAAGTLHPVGRAYLTHTKEAGVVPVFQDSINDWSFIFNSKL